MVENTKPRERVFRFFQLRLYFPKLQVAVA